MESTPKRTSLLIDDCTEREKEKERRETDTSRLLLRRRLEQWNPNAMTIARIQQQQQRNTNAQTLGLSAWWTRGQSPVSARTLYLFILMIIIHIKCSLGLLLPVGRSLYQPVLRVRARLQIKGCQSANFFFFSGFVSSVRFFTLHGRTQMDNKDKEWNKQRKKLVATWNSWCESKKKKILCDQIAAANSVNCNWTEK